MSLPTPPSTSHRDKENRLPPGSRISWSQHNEYHSLSTSPPPKQPPKPSGSRSPPTKSILKKSTFVLLPFADVNDNELCKQQREATPEPADPLTNLSYLASSVEKIVASGDSLSLKHLIEAYSVLTARLKGAVNGTTDADASWPLFQPLRRHRDAVVRAFVRDLGRALVDPGTADAACEDGRVLLPSPQSSPKRKKGMSAEQVKYARDLCTTCHAVIKLLAVVFTMPAIYRVFTNEQLRDILTQALAIPISEELPTPNARKTCALSIWLIQSQRLPSKVLQPAKDRIAYALRRGIEGELGKEGKKGSANDGLKAIHELSTYQPATFFPAFAFLLPSILSNLLAPTLTLRTQACHALGGLVLALTSLPASSATHTLHAHISASIADFLKTPTTPSKTSSSSSPSRDPVIVRTIRTTLQATDPQQAAQGPVWALTVLANFTVLLGPRLYTDAKLSRIMTALLSLSMRHKKSSVRGLGCLVWRCVAWAWFQPPFAKEDDDEDEMVADEADKEKKQTIRDMYWCVVKSVVDIGAGVATIAALLNDDPSSSVNDEDDNLRRVMQVMRCMIKKGGQTCGDAMDILKIFVSSNSSSPSPSSSEWNMDKLLPPMLFNALPGLLSAEYKSLVSAVKPIFDQCPQLEDVRSLTREELAKEWVFDELVDIWRKGLCYLELPEECGTPPEVVAVWDGLLTANLSGFQDSLNDDAGTTLFATRTADILIDILQDTNLDLTTKSGPPRKALSSSSPTRAPPSSYSNAALKLSITRDLWTVVRTTIPLELIAAAAEKLLMCLVDNEDDWVWETDSPDARKQWAMFCAEVLLVCHSDELRLFWSTSRNAGNSRKRGWSRKPDIRRLVWACFVQKWKEVGDWNWEGAVVLLGVPFVDTDAWDLDNDDFEVWDEFLKFAMNKALDYGVDSSAVLDQVASTVSQNPTPAFTDSARIADLLLTHLEISDARQIPGGLFDFVNDTLLSTYPPEPRNKVTSSWLLRSLTRVINACPAELALNLFEAIQDGVSLWITDSYEVFTEREYEDEIVPMYQTILFGIQLLPRTVDTLETVSAIVESAFCGCKDKLASLSEAFANFWNVTYSSTEEPASGWPEKIRTCLRAVATPSDDVSMIDPILLTEDAAAYDADVSMEQDTTVDDTFQESTPNNEEALPFPESEDEQESPISTPKQMEPTELPMSSEPSVSVGQLGPAFCTSPVNASQSTIVTSGSDTTAPPVFDPPQLPSTPSKAPVLTSTPPRPQKSSSAPATFLTLPLRSPTTPLPSSQRVITTPKRPPPSVALASRPSPSKRRWVEDKENMSPHPIIASFTERLNLQSPAWSTKDTVLGKRRAADEWQEGSALKKARADSGESTPSPQAIPVFGSDGSEDEWSIERSLVHDEINVAPNQLSVPLDDPFTIEPEASTSTTSDSDSCEVSARKSKRIVMDAVEVPTLREILIRERKATPGKRVLRRTRSTTRLFGPSFSQSSVYKSLEKSSRKHDKPERASDDLFSTSPFHALEDLDIAGSDDSIIWVRRPQTQTPPELSSDDDPHLGQITPHHLISPALRRAQDLTSDPPSDDSNMSASPSHQLATRRQQRLTSFSYLKPTVV